MKRSTARWTTSLAAAALLALPATGMAQTTQPPATSTQQPTTPQASTATQNVDAQQHLRQAKAALDAIAPTAVTARNKTQIAELKRHLTALERAAGSNSSASATATRGAANWSAEVAAADKILTTMLGGSTTGSPADPTAPTGTSGTMAKKPAAAASLDEATRTQLTEVRTHLTAFAAAMSGTSAPSSDASPATTGSATGAMTGSTAGATTSATTGATTGSSTAQDPTAPAQPQVDQEAARRALTDARDTLAQLTQLPAAAQLNGEARTQVSQVISNFNELITTQSEWRATYVKLEANLNALIGPDNTDAEATGGVSTGTTGTTGTAGATGTAGTTGTTAGIANLDPAIRAKLVELRQKLNAFEKASGGNVTASPSAAAPADSSAPAGSMTGSMTGTTPQATPPPATTPQTGAQAATEAMGHQEAMRHIAAIEAILNANGAGSPATGTSGSATSGTTGTTGSATPPAGAGLTLTSAQLEQLRTHLAELKRLVGEAKK